MKYQPFFVPPQVHHFYGRKDEQTLIQTNIENGPLLIYGQSGIGKTALAIAMGHKLRKQFPDGVLWFRVDTSTSDNILNTIAHIFGENVNNISDSEIKAGVVRSLLASKKTLLIFDNVDSEEQLRLLLPNTKLCSVIITSQKKGFKHSSFFSLELKAFSDNTLLTFYSSLLGNNYVKNNKKRLISLSNFSDNLPLAISIYGHHLKSNEYTIKMLYDNLVQNTFPLEEIIYDDKNLFKSIRFSFSALPKQEQQFLLSFGAFQGRDVSFAALSSVNKLSPEQTHKTLNYLRNRSLVQQSVGTRYRIHPLIEQYVQRYDLSNYLRITLEYYCEIFAQNSHNKKDLHEIIQIEFDTTLNLIEKGIHLKEYINVFTLWDHFAPFLWDKTYWKLYKKLSLNIYNLAKKLDYHENIMKICIRDIAWCCYAQGDKKKAKRYLAEGLKIAETLSKGYYLAFGKQRLAKIFQSELELKKSYQLLHEALCYFEEINDEEKITSTLRYIAEIKWLEHKFKDAEEILFKALSIADDISDLTQKAIILTRMGGLQISLGNYDQAIHYFKESTTIEKKITSGGGPVWNHLGLGIALYKLGDETGSKYHFSQSKKLMQYLGITESIISYGFFYLALKDEIPEIYS